jgi:hypothetical protein
MSDESFRSSIKLRKVPLRRGGAVLGRARFNDFDDSFAWCRSVPNIFGPPSLRDILNREERVPFGDRIVACFDQMSARDCPSVSRLAVHESTGSDIWLFFYFSQLGLDYPNGKGPDPILVRLTHQPKR